MQQLLAVPAAKAVAVLSARELASHCALPSSGHDVLVADLAALANNKDNGEPAMEIIYAALQQHYRGGES